MALLDFKEIPQANNPSGRQDTFELFARELFEILGFRILQGPSRGADGGKDLIIEESLAGIIDSTRIKWLVSCKHFAFSGRSVSPEDEKNIFERVSAERCDGFLGFYSTLPSSGLSDLLYKQTSIRTKFLDHEEIERHLLTSPKGRELIERYFPESANKLKHKPAKIFDFALRIECENCHKNLLEPPSGIWVIWSRRIPEIWAESPANENGRILKHFVDLHFSCKGECDRMMKQQIRERHSAGGFVYDGWDDIPDLAIPTVFITKIMGLLNGLVKGYRYEPAVFSKMKDLLLATFPLVSRHLSDDDRRELDRLQQIPSFLGGMGYNL